MGWFAEFSDDHGKNYARNGLTFETKEEAEDYGRSLFSRWLGATDYRISTDAKKANYKMTKKGVVRM